MSTRSDEPNADHPGPLAASWARSSRLGVEERVLAPRAARGAEVGGRLATLATPVLDRLGTSLGDTRASVILTDASAGVIDRRAGTARLRGVLDDVGLIPGWSFAEEAVGTNGMGTAAEERRVVAVVGEQHYAEALRRFSCVGVPIEHPVTGRLEGVLDLTCFEEDAGPWMTPLVAEAVAGIRAELEASSTIAERALLGAFLRAAHRAAGPVVSLNESFVLTNPAAARLLDGIDRGTLWEVGAAAVGGAADLVEDLVLAGGSMIRARFEVVRVGDRAVGTVVHLDGPQAEAGDAPGRRTARTKAPRPNATSGAVTAVARAVGEVRDGLAIGERVLVHGPAGAGKATVALAGLDSPDGRGVTVTDAARSVVDGARSWLTAVEVALRDGQAVLVRHLEVLDAAASAGLAVVLDEVPGARLVATGTGLSGGGPGVDQTLVDRFGRQVEVPALSDRGSELASLVSTIVGRLVPTGALQVAPEVIQALGRVDLPGNVRQLESVLRRVVVRRRVGTVTLDDLPPEIRAATHRPHLTAMEQHECEAIAAALAAADGNKAKAAAALGISRSTLYRKVDAFGLALDRRTY